MKAASSDLGDMSWKQENLDNANTASPRLTEPGKSNKSEGDVETAKLKGTVDERRRAR
ncbi:hypothetical protein ASPZODRAFT_129031 [Penicilliopsis zonata CBS 506.65]|uniref:Uncharacterized protein n=1 Tax=Penicilliopsis zonata CBS 506.65 TaxID=1073090 RepID=A0A1L9ST83_9EURO|nr:hypothetical protein ASPZODRAFT_129031 [Penicilliopsis zonata CBS 506.65]OJJ50409.1 hypothetical protein ASPZODRAFT_129031 [Penicilliopsis zonata CBS 506.65]